LKNCDDSEQFVKCLITSINMVMYVSLTIKLQTVCYLIEACKILVIISLLRKEKLLQGLKEERLNRLNKIVPLVENAVNK
jgi:hypothetical protein